ncbi:MAG TPA: V-type ATPase 116kDa subunit family protein, partial [Rhabdochlamydiaceae bacterium]
MNVDVKKYLFIGAEKELEHFFQRAQEQGFIEFRAVSAKKPVELPDSAQRLIAAMKILRKQPVKEAYEGPYDHAHATKVADRIIDLYTQISELHEEKRLLTAEIARVGVFGNFSLETIDAIQREGNRKVQFFCMKTAKSHKTNFSDEVLYIGTEYDLDYFIAINKESVEYPDMIEMRIDRPLGELQKRLAYVIDHTHDLEVELKGDAGYIHYLNEALIEELNQFNLNFARRDVAFPLENSLFAVEAWIPETKIAFVYGMMDGMLIHCDQIAIDPGEMVPTYLENNEVGRLGEDLINIYDTPSHIDKDPSMWVLCSFSLFFAMIIGDAGYGFLFLAAAIYLSYKFPTLKGQGKRMLKLFTLLSACCIVWGVLTSSYFGIALSSKNPLRKVSLIEYIVEKKVDYHLAAKDDVYDEYLKNNPEAPGAKTGKEFVESGAVAQFNNNILLELALIIGILHVSLGLMRYFSRNWAAIGWVFFLIGGYLYFPSVLNATSMINFLGIVSKPVATQVGLQLIYFGIGSALVL